MHPSSSFCCFSLFHDNFVELNKAAIDCIRRTSDACEVQVRATPPHQHQFKSGRAAFELERWLQAALISLNFICILDKLMFSSLAVASQATATRAHSSHCIISRRAHQAA
jgi:hypothetical protein